MTKINTKFATVVTTARTS